MTFYWLYFGFWAASTSTGFFSARARQLTPRESLFWFCWQAAVGVAVLLFARAT